MPDVELAPEGGPDGPPEKGDEEARQFILQVKKTIERCLQQGMHKAEMFRVIREEGLPSWIAFAVFEELRKQNYDFFKEYYSMHDLKEQREKLGRLIQAYRAGGSNAAAGARALETATTAAAMETDTTASMEWSGQQAEQAWLDGELPRLLASSTGGGDQQFTGGAALPQQPVHFPGGHQLHNDQQTVYNDWLQEMVAWAEEPVPAPTLARQQLHNNEQPVANGMFQGMAWPQQAEHLPPGQQLQYQQEEVGHLRAGQQEQAVQLPAWRQLHYLEEEAHLPSGQQLHYLEQAAHLPAAQQLHCQQQAVHLPPEQLPLYQDQLTANGGFHAAPLTSATGLPSDASWFLLQDSIGWGQEQQAEPALQRWPGAAADPSPSSKLTLPGGELLGNQNFPSSNAGIHERPQ